MEIILIEHVRAHSCLYDIKSKYYRDQSMRQEAWEEIGREMNVTSKYYNMSYLLQRIRFYIVWYIVYLENVYIMLFIDELISEKYRC